MAHKVQNLVATNVTSSSVELSWDDVTSLTGELYDIERDGVIVEGSYAGGLTFTDTGLDPDTEYTYRVRAVGGTTAGEPNPSVTPTTVAARASVSVPVVVASTPSVSITPTTVTAVASVATPRIGESDVDPWGIVAARSAISMPVGAVVITAGVDDPQTVINANPAGTTYWFNGTFAVTTRIVPKSGDTLVTNNAILDGGATWTTGDRYTDGSTYTGCDIGLDPKNGTALPASPRTNVTIKGFEVRNFTEVGIRPWLGSDIQYCLVHDCFTNGIGTGMQNQFWSTYQASITDCIVWDCGSADQLGVSGGGVKLARTGDGSDVKNGGTVSPSAEGRGIYVARLYSWRNTGMGLWWDITSGGDYTEDCIFDTNSRKGYHYEVSVGPTTITRCTARDNGAGDAAEAPISSNYALDVVTSKGVVITENRISGSWDDNGIRLKTDGRAVEYGHGTDGIVVTNNNLLDSDVYFKAADVTGTVTASGNTNYGAGVYGASYDGTFDPDILITPDADVALATVTTASVVLTPTVSTPSLPTQPVAGAYAWWRADYLLGLSSLPADGAAVSSWEDVSGNSRHAAQATGADQPHFKTNIQNGLPVVRFLASNSEIMTTGLTLAQPWTVVAAVNFTASAASRKMIGGSNAQVEMGVTAADLLIGYAGAGLSDSSGAADGSWRIVHWVCNGASSHVSRGDGDRTSGTSGTNALNTLNIGGQAAGTMDGDIGEIIIYNSALSIADVNTVATALKARWNATWTNFV